MIVAFHNTRFHKIRTHSCTPPRAPPRDPEFDRSHSRQSIASFILTASIYLGDVSDRALTLYESTIEQINRASLALVTAEQTQTRERERERERERKDRTHTRHDPIPSPSTKLIDICVAGTRADKARANDRYYDNK
jgi:hypothetical protein